ncbi:MAG: hypothetical protein IPG80_10845 [Anaerolineales bacterium]|uniref:hypothetical protein n=1 Tax=Candidatus Villigracilis vicinus TaxID=3140679 RepID=UPI003136B004|nr:hypothetical protein [Anaerolineales bacterium]
MRASIDALAKKIELKHVPQILIGADCDEIYEMGSFRRWYIVFRASKAKNLQELLANPRKAKLAEVQILHELFHFKNGDYWQLGYLAELFKVSFNLMIWVLIFLGGWGFLLVLVKDAFFQFSITDLIQHMPVDVRPTMEQILPSMFPSIAEMEALRIKAEGINFIWVLNFISNISLPYIVVAGILWRFYRPLLWRVREFYADAGVIAVQKSVKPFVEFIRRANQVPLQAVPVIAAPSLKEIARKITNRFGIFLTGVFWADFSKRFEALKVPESIFFTWKQIAWFLGFLALSLEVFLATPLSLPMVGNNPMTFTTLVVTAALVYFLLPQLVMGKSAWKDALRVLFVIFGIRTVWMFFTLALMWGLYFINPEFLSSVLQSAISSVARYAGTDPIGIDLPGFLVESLVINVLQILIIFVVQIISVTGLLFLIKRTLQWHSFITDSERFKRVVFSLTFGVLFVLLTLVMPFSMAVLKGDFSAFMGASGVFAILGMLTLVGGGIWFFVQDQHRYQRESILHPWFWVEYEDE